VGREARDTSIPMALGARASRAAGRVLGRVLVLAAAGVSVGLAGAFLGRELVATFVVGVTATDRWTMGVVACGVLGLAAIAASGAASLQPRGPGTRASKRVAAPRSPTRWPHEGHEGGRPIGQTRVFSLRIRAKQIR
jgi:hypothetical protein